MSREGHALLRACSARRLGHDGSEMPDARLVEALRRLAACGLFRQDVAEKSRITARHPASDVIEREVL